MSPRRSVLVVGASGGTGRQLVIGALRRGLRVRAWSRVRWELPLAHVDLEHVVGDVRDPTVARRAVDGVAAVLCALGSQAGLARTDVCAQGSVGVVTLVARRNA